MATDLGGSQISALLEAVPGIRNVLRSPVADALVNTIRAAAGVRAFAFAEADELVQYAVRRGLIGQSEGDQVLDEVRGRERGGRPAAARGPSTGGKRPARKKAAAAKPQPRQKTTRRPVKKRAPRRG